MKKLFIAWTILGILIITLLVLGLYPIINNKKITVSNFEECTLLPDSVIEESYPAVCITNSGEKYTQTIENGSLSPLPVTPITRTAKDGCVITGCSSQVCAEEDIVTTCEFKEEYGCYDLAICEKQSDGKCGWTETNEFLSCLNDANNLEANL